MTALGADPILGHAKVTFEQIKEVGQFLWREMGKFVDDGKHAGGQYLLDEMVPVILNGPKFQAVIMQRQRAVGAGSEGSSMKQQESGGNAAQERKIKQLEKQVQDMRAAA